MMFLSLSLLVLARTPIFWNSSAKVGMRYSLDGNRRHARAFSRLWADNQVRRQNAAEKQLHTSTPHTRKKGGETKK